VSPRQEHDATKRRDAIFRAYVDEGGVKEAAHRFGITERAVRKQLAAYCEAHGYTSLVHAVFHFGTSKRGAEPRG
jgi:hypothetical protein